MHLFVFVLFYCFSVRDLSIMRLNVLALLFLLFVSLHEVDLGQVRLQEYLNLRHHAGCLGC